MTNFLVHTHVDDDLSSWEISLVAKDNDFGRSSWGWFGVDKLPVAVVEDWMTDELDQPTRSALFAAGVEAAEKLCEKLGASAQNGRDLSANTAIHDQMQPVDEKSKR